MRRLNLALILGHGFRITKCYTAVVRCISRHGGGERGRGGATRLRRCRRPLMACQHGHLESFPVFTSVVLCPCCPLLGIGHVVLLVLLR